MNYTELQHNLRLIEHQAREAATLAAMGAELRASGPAIATPANPNPVDTAQQAVAHEDAARAKVADVLIIARRMHSLIFKHEGGKLPSGVEPTKLVPGG